MILESSLPQTVPDLAGTTKLDKIKNLRHFFHSGTVTDCVPAPK